MYGLGSESQNLPGFVVLSSGVGTSGGASNFMSGFLPSSYQGVMFRNSGDPILYLSNPQGVAPERQRADLDAIRDLNEEHYAKTGDAEIASRINSYELAFRMQSSAPIFSILSKESPAHARDVWRQQRAHPSFCNELPAGAAHGRARRPLRDADARQLGPAHVL